VLVRTLDNHNGRIDTAQATITAINTWRRWVAGHHVTPDQLQHTATTLQQTNQPDHTALATSLLAWLERNGLAQAILSEPTKARDLPTLDL